MITKNKTFIRLLTGLTVYFTIVIIVGMVFLHHKKIIYLLGLLLGIITCIIWAYNIAYSYSKAIEMEESTAVKYMRKVTVIRLSIITIIAVLLSLFKVEIGFGYIVGLLGLKFSAYFQIILNKILDCKRTKNG